MHYDVRSYNATQCNQAIEAYEAEIACGRGNTEMYSRAIASLHARIAELNGNTVEWIR